jgi:hypothetical protein
MELRGESIRRSLTLHGMLALGFFAALSPLSLAQDPVFDDFERHLLGASWTVLVPGSGIVNQSDLGVTSGTGCAVGWTGSIFAVDQFSETQLSIDVDPVMLQQVFVRRRASDNARYGFHWNGDLGNSRWEIKYDGVPTPQTVILASANGFGPAPGDAIRIEACGTSPVMLRGFHNGQLLITAFDSSPQRITIAGVAGVVSRPRQGSAITPPSPIFESWSGGSLEHATVYCTSQPNSIGCIPAIGFSGVPSATAGSGFFVTASSVLNHRAGLLFYGTAGPASAPLGLGTRCVAAPLRRTPIQDSGGNPGASDCSGRFSFDFNAWIASLADPSLVPGQDVWAQYYSRDPGFAPPNNTNVTDAVRFVVCP